MAVVRVEEEDADTFRHVFTEVLRRLETLHGRDQVRWFDLMRFVMTWASWRRPGEEREALLAAAQTIPTSAVGQEEVKKVTQTIREWYIEQGVIQTLQNQILRQGRQRLGEPAPAVIAAINALTDRERLEQLTDRVWEVSDWQDLLSATPPPSLESPANPHASGQ
jgi:hypothetical protein